MINENTDLRLLSIYNYFYTIILSIIFLYLYLIINYSYDTKIIFQIDILVLFFNFLIIELSVSLFFIFFLKINYRIKVTYFLSKVYLVLFGIFYSHVLQLYGIIFINCFFFDFLADFSMGYVCQNAIDFTKIQLLIIHTVDIDIIKCCKIDAYTNFKYIDSILLNIEYDKIKNFVDNVPFKNIK